jgi:hypothetical protein
MFVRVHRIPPFTLHVRCPLQQRPVPSISTTRLPSARTTLTLTETPSHAALHRAHGRRSPLAAPPDRPPFAVKVGDMRARRQRVGTAGAPSRWCGSGYVQKRLATASSALRAACTAGTWETPQGTLECCTVHLQGGCRGVPRQVVLCCGCLQWRVCLEKGGGGPAPQAVASPVSAGTREGGRRAGERHIAVTAVRTRTEPDAGRW